MWKSLSYPERYSSKNARKVSILVAVVLGIAPGVTFVLIDLVLFPFFFFGSLTMILVVVWTITHTHIYCWMCPYCMLLCSHAHTDHPLFLQLTGGLGAIVILLGTG